MRYLWGGETYNLQDAVYSIGSETHCLIRLTTKYKQQHSPCGEKQAIESSHVGRCQLYCLAVVVLCLQQEMQICTQNLQNILQQIVALSTSLNFSSPAQVARSHPKCNGSLLASGGRDGCVGCAATPEQFDSKLSSTGNCQTSSQQKAALA